MLNLKKLYEGRKIEPERLPDGHSHFGRYFATTREKMEELDPAGFALVKKFFSPYLSYTPILPVDFEGAFSLALDEEQPYTWKSQHLKDVSLSGENNSSLMGNNMDNVLSGNAGDNQFTGGAGNDLIDGGEGKDVAWFSGNEKEYVITKEDGKTIIEDKEENRDGKDVLMNIEIIRFGDKELSL